MPRPQSESAGSFGLFFFFFLFFMVLYAISFLLLWAHTYTPRRQVGYGHGSYEDADTRSFGNGRVGLTKRVASERVGLYDYTWQAGGELENTKNSRTHG